MAESTETQSGPFEAVTKDISYEAPEIPILSSTTVDSTSVPECRPPSLPVPGREQTSSKSVSSSSTPTEIARADSVPPSGSNATLNYKEPAWACRPNSSYYLEVLKNGVVVDNIKLHDGKSYFLVGRLPGQCDICSEHPSSSRFHAVFQYGRQVPDEKDGFYLYDLDSTHGTIINKARIPPETFVRLKVGYVVKFGSSTRLYIVQGPTDEDEEADAGLTVTQIKELQIQKLQNSEKKSDDATKKEAEDGGIDWGFGEDATDDDVEHAELGQLGSISSHDAYYSDDPRKALNAFYLREGMDMEHEIEELGHGNKKQYHCRIPLPIDAPNGRQLVADGTANRKKEALAQAILEACRLLHAQGALKGTTSIGRRHKGKNWADEDFYDSDEDTFTDRTGTVERKREKRIQRSGKKEQVTETFESLSARLDALKVEVEEITAKIQKAEKNKADSIGQGSLDELDGFMEAVKAGLILDPKTRIKLKQRLTELRQEEFRLLKVINLVKPLDLPPILPSLGRTTGVAVPDTSQRLKAPALPAAPARIYNHSDRTEFVAEEEDLDESASTGTCAKPRQPELVSVEASAQKKIPVIPKASEKRPLTEEDLSRTLHAEEVTSTEEPPAAVETTVSRPYVQTAPAKKRKPDSKKSVEYDASDPDYAMWIPPDDQAGDGKTSLNERLGY